MEQDCYPFAVRLIGFAEADGRALAALLAQAPPGGPAYVCLHEDSLQEPDLYLVNGDDMAALARLATLNPSVLQPAAIVGNGAVSLPLPQLRHPLLPVQMFPLLQEMIARRADALSQVTAVGWPSLPERRRRQRLDFDLTDPAEYAAKRRAPPDGAILLVDKGPGLRDHVQKLLGRRRKVAVAWTADAAGALQRCASAPVSAVLINVSTPGVDPYTLCRAIKDLPQGAKVAVVFLVGKSFDYDAARARTAGVRGLLDKPVADRHLLGALQKLLSLPL